MKKSIINFIFNFLVIFIRFKKIGKLRTDVGVATLLCHRDVNRYIYSLSSLFFQLHMTLPLYIVDDGSLTQDDTLKLHTYFSVTIEDAASASKKMRSLTQKYPSVRKLRFDKNAGVFKKKLDVYLLCPFDRFMYLDSDILFFGKPKEILYWIQKKINRAYYTLRREDLTTFSNREAVITQFSFRKLLYTYIKSSIHPLFIAGFLCLPHKKALNLTVLSRSIETLYTYSYAHAALAEETAVAMSLDSNIISYLPIDRYVNINCMAEYAWSHTLKNKIFIHYSGEMKFFLFQVDAIRLALSTGFFR